MRRAGALAALAAICGACSSEVGPRAQYIVHIATDAPLPAFGERLLIEVLRPDGTPCEGCQRIFVADAASVPLSFGVRPPPEQPLRVRARLYRSDHVAPDGYPAGAVLDAIGVLPAEPSEVALVLRMDCFGVAADPALALSCDPASGALAPAEVLAAPRDMPAVGSWPLARAVPCDEKPEAGMVCIPGGAFLMGDVYSVYPPSSEGASVPERVVVLSPFAIDAREMTVGDMAMRLPAGTPPGELIPRSGDASKDAFACTYATDGSTNDLPVNCVSHALAAQVCEARGGRLPREAEWEYVAGNLSFETRFPWGDEEDFCDEAIVARGRVTSPTGVEEITSCLAPPDYRWGPVAGGAATDMTGVGVMNLGGNVNEWVEDAFARYDDPCWTTLGRFPKDPSCVLDEPVARRVIRGGEWSGFAFAAAATSRNAGAPGPSIATGFRCVKPASQKAP